MAARLVVQPQHANRPVYDDANIANAKKERWIKSTQEQYASSENPSLYEPRRSRSGHCLRRRHKPRYCMEALLFMTWECIPTCRLQAIRLPAR